MGLKWPEPGINHVPSYQVSGMPFITRSVQEEVPYASPADPVGSSIKVEFPFVTSWVQIKNISTTKKIINGYHTSPVLMFGFTANGVAGPPPSIPDHAAAKASTEAYVTNDIHWAYIKRAVAITPGVKTPRMPIRCKEIYLSTQRSDLAPHLDSYAAFEVIAGLTNIPRDSFPTLTGSDGFEGVG